MPRAHDPLWDDLDVIFASRNFGLSGIGKALDKAAKVFDSFDVPCIPEGLDPRKRHRKNAGAKALAAIATAPVVAEARLGRRPGGDFSLRNFSFRYEIGGGGFGTVHLAKCNLDGKFYAVKSQLKSQMADHYKQCNEEIRLQKKCRKPWVASLIGTFQDAMHLFMVLELEPGDFETILKTRGPLTVKEARFYVAEMICAIHTLHLLNVIHCDIKPGNFLVDKEGHLKISDFGLAKEAHRPVNRAGGTWAYMAPEIVLGQSYLYGPDWWACGVCFYEMLCGRVPFDKYWPRVARGQISREEYGQILIKGPPTWPTTATRDAGCLSLLKQLLHPDQKLRIGVKQGISEFMKHPFLANVPFNKVWNRATRHTPFKLEMRFDWDKRDGSAEIFGLPGPDKYGKLFNY